MAPFIQKTVYSDPMVDYIRYSANLRGMLLHEFAEMERMMDEYICRHFCRSVNKRTELMETIVATKFLTFNAKCQIIRHLLIKKRHVSKKQAEKAYDNLTKEVARLRNIIAHSSLDTSGSAIDLFKRDKTITFTKYDKGKNSEKITKAKHIKISEIIQAAKGYFFMKNYAKRNKPKP